MNWYNKIVNLIDTKQLIFLAKEEPFSYENGFKLCYIDNGEIHFEGFNERLELVVYLNNYIESGTLFISTTPHAIVNIENLYLLADFGLVKLEADKFRPGSLNIHINSIEPEDYFAPIHIPNEELLKMEEEKRLFMSLKYNIEI